MTNDDILMVSERVRTWISMVLGMENRAYPEYARYMSLHGFLDSQKRARHGRNYHDRGQHDIPMILVRVIPVAS